MRKGRYIRRRTASRMLTTVLALLLVVGLSVGGTLAWLTAQTEDVTNTFTIGDINIKLDESVLKNDNTLDTTKPRVQGNDNYKIVPGGKSPKDPILTVESGSEKCYAYVCITNTMKLEGGTSPVVTHNLDTTKWTKVAESGDKVLYRYFEIVNALEAEKKLPVFTEVSYAETILKTDIGELDNEKYPNKLIKIEGFAHQSDNITDVSVADAAAKAQFGF